MIKAIAHSPCPIIPAEREHVLKCLRVMQSVLPKRALDDVSGQIFMSAYVRKLCELTAGQVSHIADKALEKCRWFPTIAECLELLEGYVRTDAERAAWEKAKELAAKESRRRERDAARAAIRQRLEDGDRTLWLTEWQIERLPPEIVAPGLENGMLVRREGRIMDARSAPDYEPVKFTPPEPAQRKGPDCKRCHDLGRILDLDGNEVNCPECAA